MSNEQFHLRLAKLKSWAQHRPPMYPDTFDKSHTAALLKAAPDGDAPVSCAGRLLTIRDMGKLAFAHLQDHSGRIQVALNARVLGVDEYKFLLKHLDTGDYIGVKGVMFTSKTGEKTVNVSECRLLSKALRPLPEKWHGLADEQIRARQRYLDLIANAETRRKFEIRSQVLKFIRARLEGADFLEVETPILQAASSGASARPFETHHHALDIPLYLRIAPETYLKRLMVGGYERVFEMGKCFRNEGLDPSHLQEFTMLEYYAAYWNYRDNMKFIQSLIQDLVFAVAGSHKITFQGTEIDFSGDWPEVTYRDLVLRDTGIDLDVDNTLEKLRAAVRARGLEMSLDEYVGVGALMDALYKKFCRPRLIQPMFLTMHPQEIVPLARRSDADPKRLDMFQVLVNSWEVVKAYSELVDPVEQKTRLLEQAELAKQGDVEAMMFEEDFILCMEYGMPPMSGLGFGVDRFITLLTDSKSIRDVIYFPFLRPPTSAEVDAEQEPGSQGEGSPAAAKA